jgi:replication fork clamp-binding protein CrfC
VSQRQDRRPVIVELLDHTRSIADLNDRGDLSARLAAARERITDPLIRVVIVGQLKQGKSQLLNSLLNMPVARVGDDESTVLITVVGYAEEPTARVILDAGGGHEQAVEVPVADLGSDLRRAPRAGGHRVVRVEVGAPSPLLKGGLTFLDTPGVGGPGQPHLSATLGSSAMPARSSPNPNCGSCGKPLTSVRSLRPSPPRPTSTRSGGRWSTPTSPTSAGRAWTSR